MKVLSKALVMLAVMALITGVSLFVVGGYLVSWPILRSNPRTARKRALTQVALSLMTLAQAYAPDEADDGMPIDRRTEARATAPDRPEDSA